MRLLVCGGRNLADYAAVLRAITDIRPSSVIHGGARGADALADRAAKALGIPVSRFPADWKRHGRAAGFIRNQQMLDEGRPDMVLAFPGGRGTADMVRRAREAGFPVRLIGAEGLDRVRKSVRE